MNRIALCMIARNEERFIGDCLRSVQGTVDQMIVVDTGSQDRTVEIAQSAGAQVVQFAWCDDFAAARNAALATVDAEWILVLDADERLAPSDAHRLRSVVKDAIFDVGLIALHNATDLHAQPADILSGAKRQEDPILLPRLIRRDPRLQWNGVIHESVADWVRAGRKTVKHTDLNIVHYGNVPELRATLDKANRNLKLCEKRCAINPSDFQARTYLARELIRVNQAARARVEIDRAYGDLMVAMNGPPPRPTPVSTATVRAHLALQEGDTQTVLQTVAQIRSFGISHPNLDLLEGVAWETRAFADTPAPEALRRACAAFLAATEHHGTIFDEEVLPGATSWAAATRLGIVLLADQQPKLALQVLEAAVASKEDHRAAQLAHAETLIALGREQEALRALEPILQPRDPNGWLIATEACIALGVEAGARTFYVRLIRAEQAGAKVAAHRRSRRSQLNSEDQTASSWAG
jgi:tetratricopeptide (TPR) repeat protein